MHALSGSASANPQKTRRTKIALLSMACVAIFIGYKYAHLVDTPHQDWAISASNNKHSAEMSAVSPRGHLAGLRVPVYILHGRSDTLIPFAEAEWLAQVIEHAEHT